MRQSNVTGYGLASPCPFVRCSVAATPRPQSRLGAKAVANSLYIGEAEAQTPLTGWPWVADTHDKKRAANMKAIDCPAPDAAHIHAEDDDSLFKELRRHADEVHADAGFTDEALHEMVRDAPVDAQHASAG